MSNFAIYLIGFFIVIAGLAWGAFQMGISPLWIGIGVVVLVGLGILSGVSRTRQREKPPTES